MYHVFSEKLQLVLIYSNRICRMCRCVSFHISSLFFYLYKSRSFFPRDIHIIDVEGSGNSNGSLVLEVHGQALGGNLSGHLKVRLVPTAPDSSFIFSNEKKEYKHSVANNSFLNNNHDIPDDADGGGVIRRSNDEEYRNVVLATDTIQDATDSFRESEQMQQTYASGAVVRNLTLVLRSVRPVTWLIQPSSIIGTITVLLVRSRKNMFIKYSHIMY